MIQNILAAFYTKQDALTPSTIQTRAQHIFSYWCTSHLVQDELDEGCKVGLFVKKDDGRYTLAVLNPKGRLQESMQKEGWTPPKYETCACDGEAELFQSTYTHPHLGLMYAFGRTKQLAEEHLARLFLAMDDQAKKTNDRERNKAASVDDKKEEEEEGLTISAFKASVKRQIQIWAAEAHPALAKEMNEWIRTHIY